MNKQARPCKFYKEGNCRKGELCTFSHHPRHKHDRRTLHQERPQPAPFTQRITYSQYAEQSRALLASKELINGGNLFYFGTPRIDWQSFLFNKMFLNLQHISQRQAHDFVFACLASTVLPSDILVNIAAPQGQKVGIKLLTLMFEAEYSTNITQAGSSVLNFQNVLAPLISFLTHPGMIDSALHEYSSAIINLCRKNLALVFPAYMKCLEKITDENMIIQDGFEQLYNNDTLNVFPVSFVQLYLPIVRLIHVIITHFRDESYNQFMLTSIESLANLHTKLELTAVSETGSFTTNLVYSMGVLRREMDSVLMISNIARLELKMAELFVKERPPTLIENLNTTDYWQTPIKNIPGKPAIHDNDFYEIRDISIVPTMKEIICGSVSVLPGNYHELPNAHWLTQSPQRLLDTQFRLLRHDLFGPLRDNALGCLEYVGHPKSKGGITIKNGRIRNTGDSGSIDIYLYSNVKFIKFSVLNREFSILVQFDQPSHLSNQNQRRAFWDSNRLQHGSLIGLVIAVNGSRNVYFGTVVVDRKEGSLIKENPSIRISFATTLNTQALSYLIRYSGPKDFSPHLLFENNNIMFESYRAVLQAIQNNNPLNFPFAEYLCYPKLNSTDVMKSPLYCQVPGFQLNFSFLTNGHDTALDPKSENSKQICVEQLQQYSTMDKGQAEAFVTALSSQIACIQGPPGMSMINILGTGKSFVGTKIVQAMIQNKRKISETSPIFLICYTNHALDQFIEELLDLGITDICRLGSRSNSERIQKLSLRNQEHLSKPRGGRREERNCIKVIEECENKLNNITDKISYKLKWFELAPYLEMNYPDQFDSFNEMYQEMEFEKLKGWIKAGKQGNLELIDAWLKGQDLIDLHDEETNSRPRKLQALLLVQDVYSMSKQERSVMLEHWKNEVPSLQYERVYHLAHTMSIAKKNLDNIRTSYDVDVIRCKQIIAATTTGAARYQDLIKAVSPKIIVVEEAGEVDNLLIQVLEAHILSALHPNVQQLILIGDHFQLRPQIADYNLSQESNQGKKYRLDMSLFERLQDPHYVVPMKTLSIQRRMRPEVSDLIRYTLYPKLEDHQQVKEYPRVPGFKENVFFISHDKPQDSSTNAAYVTSHSNQYEVEYAIALLQFLLRNGAKAVDCVILTPYVGQLMKLRNSLKNEFTVQLEERDLKELQGFDDTLEEGENTTITAERVSLQNVIRVATIDNYQGEESKYVIISLVRSTSPKKSIGFLKTSNRINVLLSRAKHGMYMIGNDSLLRMHSEMWTNVLDILETRNQVGPEIVLFCTQHPDYMKQISDPNDIVSLFPDGGCSRKCTVKLPNCGHMCPFKCHSDFKNHVGITCIADCARLHDPCQHPCVKRCNRDCGECLVDVGDVQLPCGHVSKNTKCHMAQHPELIKCGINVLRTVSKCSHIVTVSCSTNMEKFKCSNICNGQLGCIHKCSLRCSDDCKSDEHEVCQKKCKKPLVCGHYCNEKCHVNNNICPPCKSICSIWSCHHSNCEHECAKPCCPCQNACVWKCEHEGECQLICGAPCTRLPCDKRCSKLLKCGHQCVSPCGEPCPDQEYCQVCASDKIKTTVVDMILSQEYREIDLSETQVLVLGCGHFFTVETLDGLMDLKKAYKLDESGYHCVALPAEFLKLPCCATCRGPIRNIRRYGRILNHCSGQVSEMHFIVNARTEIAEIQAMIEQVKYIEFKEMVSPHKESYRMHRLVSNEVSPISNKLAKLKKNVLSSPRKYLYESCVSFLQKNGPINPLELLLSVPEPYRGLEREVIAIEIDLEAFMHNIFYLASIATIIPEEKPRLLVRYKTGMTNILNKTKKHLKKDPNLLAETSGCALRFFDLQIKLQFYSRSRESDELSKLDNELKDFIVKALPSFIYSNKTAIKDMETKIANSINGPFYELVTEEEKRIIFQTLNAGFTGGGHWYQCPNGHMYAIGNCGLPNQSALCAECSLPIGGNSYQLATGNQRATNL